MLVGTGFGQPERWTATRWGLLAVAAAFGYLVVGYNSVSILVPAACGVLGALVAWGADPILKVHLLPKVNGCSLLALKKFWRISKNNENMVHQFSF